MIAVLRDHFTPAEKKVLAKFVAWGRRVNVYGEPTNPVLLLTSNELTIDHHVLSGSSASKFTVWLTFLVRNKNEYHLIDVFRQKLEFPELNKFVIAHAQKYNADAILIDRREPLASAGRRQNQESLRAGPLEFHEKPILNEN